MITKTTTTRMAAYIVAFLVLGAGAVAGLLYGLVELLQALETAFFS